MIIDGVLNTTGAYSLTLGGTSDSDGPAEQIPGPIGVAEPTLLDPPVGGEVQVDTPDPAGDADPEDGQGAGVLRLLQEGHFKGVADVRVRINFHDQIAAAEAEATRVAATEAIGDLSSTINTQLDELGASDELNEDQLANLGQLQSTFDEAIEAAAQTVSGATELAGDPVTEDIQQAFDSLTTSLESLLAPAPDPVPEGEAPLVESEETTDYEAQLQSLRGTFEAAMQTLSDALTPTSLLPELSLPTGNGVAYEKFLGIYNELQGPLQSEEPEVEPPVDISV